MQYFYFNRTTVKIIIIAFASAFTLGIQGYCWPNAGKTAPNNYHDYSFQMDYWSEEIFNKFDKVKSSNSYPKLALYTGEKKVNAEFFGNIKEYHYHVSNLLRTANNQANVAISLLMEIRPLLDRMPKSYDNESLKSAHDAFTRFGENLERHQLITREIGAFLPNLIDAFITIPAKEALDTDEKIELTKHQVSLLQQLYSSEELFLKRNSDPFKFVRDFAKSTEEILIHYQEITTKYNTRVKTEEAYKTALIMFVTLLVAFLTLREKLTE